MRDDAQEVLFLPHRHFFYSSCKKMQGNKQASRKVLPVPFLSLVAPYQQIDGRAQQGIRKGEAKFALPNEEKKRRR